MNVVNKRLGESNICLMDIDKFKTKTIVIRIKRNLDNKEYTALLLLSSIMESVTKKHKTANDLKGYLSFLYGARLKIVPITSGPLVYFDLRVSFVDERFLPRPEELLEKVLLLLKEALYNPLLVGKNHNLFDRKVFNTYKALLERDIQNQENEKKIHAYKQFLNLLGADKPEGLFEGGDLKELKKIKNSDLVKLYYELVDNNLEFYLIGNFDLDKTVALIDKHFDLTKKAKPLKSWYSIDKKEVKRKSLTKEYNQSQVFLAYTIDALMGKDFRKEAIAALFNAYFGGTPISQLFLKVREKHSLCYSVYSTAYSSFSYLLINLQVDAGNINKAERLIKEIVEDIKAGKIDEVMFEYNRKILLTGLERVEDNINSIFSFYANIIGAGIYRSIDDYRNMYSTITKEEIQAFAQSMVFKTGFTLKGIKKDEEDISAN